MNLERYNKKIRRRHKGPPSQIEQCQHCGRLVINDSLFPFAMCTGTEDDHHGPSACRKA
jgi:hypothetical protein